MKSLGLQKLVLFFSGSISEGRGYSMGFLLVVVSVIVHVHELDNEISGQLALENKCGCI